MKIPTAGPPADTETLREQIATARDALSAAVASLDGAEEVAGRDLPIGQLVSALRAALAATQWAGDWCRIVETVLTVTGEPK